MKCVFPKISIVKNEKVVNFRSFLIIALFVLSSIFSALIAVAVPLLGAVLFALSFSFCLLLAGYYKKKHKEEMFLQTHYKNRIPSSSSGRFKYITFIVCGLFMLCSFSTFLLVEGSYSDDFFGDGQLYGMVESDIVADGTRYITLSKAKINQISIKGKVLVSVNVSNEKPDPIVEENPSAQQSSSIEQSSKIVEIPSTERNASEQNLSKQNLPNQNLTEQNLSNQYSSNLNLSNQYSPSQNLSNLNFEQNSQNLPITHISSLYINNETSFSQNAINSSKIHTSQLSQTPQTTQTTQQDSKYTTQYSQNQTPQQEIIRTSQQPTQQTQIEKLESGTLISITAHIANVKLLDFSSGLRVDSTSFRNNIRYKAEVDGGQITNSIIKGEINAGIMTKLREKIHKTLVEAMGEDNASIAFGMIVGDKTYINSQTKLYFSIAGLSHILAVSGLHLTVLCGFIMFFLKKLRLNRKINASINIFLIVFYIFLADFSPSILRAGLMSLVGVYIFLIGSRKDILNSLACAFCVILAFAPFFLFDAGFILSVCCVFGIALFSDPISHFLTKIRFPKALNRIVSTTLAIQISAFPACIYIFKSFQPYSLLVNIVLIPCITLIFLALFASLLFSLATTLLFPLKICAFGIEGIDFVAQMIAQLPFARLIIYSTYLIFLCYVLFFVMSRYVIKRSRAIIPILCVTQCILLVFLQNPTAVLPSSIVPIHFSYSNVSVVRVEGVLDSADDADNADIADIADNADIADIADVADVADGAGGDGKGDAFGLSDEIGKGGIFVVGDFWSGSAIRNRLASLKIRSVEGVFVNKLDKKIAEQILVFSRTFDDFIVCFPQNMATDEGINLILESKSLKLAGFSPKITQNANINTPQPVHSNMLDSLDNNSVKILIDEKRSKNLDNYSNGKPNINPNVNPNVNLNVNPSVNSSDGILQISQVNNVVQSAGLIQSVNKIQNDNTAQSSGATQRVVLGGGFHAVYEGETFKAYGYESGNASTIFVPFGKNYLKFQCISEYNIIRSNTFYGYLDTKTVFLVNDCDDASPEIISHTRYFNYALNLKSGEVYSPKLG